MRDSAARVAAPGEVRMAMPWKGRGWAEPGSSMSRVVVHVRPLDPAPPDSERCPEQDSKSAHRVLREVAAAYAGASYASAPIVRSPNGKPRFERGGLEFSLSHQGGWCAVALSKDGPVGVDLEPIRVFPEMETVALHFFPKGALAEFQRAAPTGAAAVFFKWWTRLEAAVKAAQGGLDTGAHLLNAVTHQGWSGLDGFALGVAALGRRPLAVEWNLLLGHPGEHPDRAPAAPSPRPRLWSPAVALVFPRA